MIRLIVVVGFLLATVGSWANSFLWLIDEQDVNEVSSWIEGSYSTERQAKQDTAFRNERMEIRRIWMDRTDGVWFVLERFEPEMQSKPFQQRVIHIHGVEENLTEVRTFVWKDASTATELWKNPEKAAQFSVEDIRLQRGCEMYLQRNSSAFFGGTHGTACSGGRAGVSYLNISISIADQSIALWERGYSVDNKQILGSVKGPYYYLKQKL
ncbi:MAG: hypothetical protein FJ211_03710 [Ignavibacteria bacterium]|nr:hypothetical protein [Ignavibacteria bacterium]